MTNKYIMVCRGLSSGAKIGCYGQYLKSFDPEAYDGRGSAIFTDKIDEAMKFDSAVSLLDLWRKVSKTRPYREDGKPNRPLTAFNIEIRRAQ